MLKQQIIDFLARHNKALSAQEESNLTILIDALQSDFPDFDVYTWVYGSKPMIKFGFYGGDSNTNKPAFGIYKRTTDAKCSFGLSFDSTKLRDKVKIYDDRFELGELHKAKVELKKFLHTLKSIPEIEERMSGNRRVIIDNAEQVQSAEADEHNHDWREDVETTIKMRRGQPAFRQALVSAYGNKCAVTGCRIEGLLEAAHIVPHCQGTNYEVSNGLLLRADIHTLYDIGLLTIAGDGTICLAEELNDDPTYAVIADKALINFPLATPEVLEKLKASLAKRYAKQTADKLN
ncbi:HNH endonuclease [Shewanella sp. 1CM18E]|uniref:HNH endonuclease n=1 Tax=Shewanella sp. 1CM18E TaxID=2929169 RepID=UPI0020C03D2F|nr:HNH endonuclease signature motif containing protein [Shewanella sp. 1CM18E]MCK8047163.1 HNH endonuclease [Shewanella sp. 1CM18E]